MIGGCTTAVWDLIAQPYITKLRDKLRQRRSNSSGDAEAGIDHVGVQLNLPNQSLALQRRRILAGSTQEPQVDLPQLRRSDSSTIIPDSPSTLVGSDSNQPMDTHSHSLHMKWGILIIVLFFGLCSQYCPSIPEYHELRDKLLYSKFRCDIGCARRYGEAHARP